MKKKYAQAGRRLAAAAAALGLLLAVWLLVDWVDARMQAQEVDLLREQVRRAAINCYASEGRYPQDVSYLMEYYGLIYDAERYSILYDAFASNIMPDIDVLVKGDNRP